jgi:hypothetical protein
MQHRTSSARWQSGYAEDCKSSYLGSIPGRASNLQMSLKKTDLEKLLGKKIASDSTSGRGGRAPAMSRREQALARKRELLEKHRKAK